jgi:hypothetical protein
VLAAFILMASILINLAALADLAESFRTQLTVGVLSQ